MNRFVIYDMMHLHDLDPSDRAQAAKVWDEAHAVATLQGLVNRSEPRLYIRYVQHDGVNVDDYWLDKITAEGAWLAGAPIERVNTLEELVTRFADQIHGAVIFDASLPALSNLASSFAGAEKLVAIRHEPTDGSVYDRLINNGPRLAIRRQLFANDFAADENGSRKGSAYRWAANQLIESNACDPSHLAYYIDAHWIDHAAQSVPNHHTLTNHDYFVAKKAFFCDLDCWTDEPATDEPDQQTGADFYTLTAILRSLHECRRGGGLLHVGGFTPWAFKYTDYPGVGGKHDGVQSEWELVRVISAFDGFLDADAIGHGAMANASFFAHFPLRQRYSQTSTDDRDRQQFEAAVAEAQQSVRDGGDLVMFYVGDFDSAAWIYQRMPDLWDDPRRGETPLSWSISPVLCRRSPMVMDYLWRTRRANDFFISANCGAGYLNPAMLLEPRPMSGYPSGLAKWRDHCKHYYDQWDMRITGFIIDGLAPPSPPEALSAYEQFSPDGVVLHYADQLARLQGSMPVLARGPDIGGDNPRRTAEEIAKLIAADHDACDLNDEPRRYHWFRGILQSPSWYSDVTSALRELRPNARVVGAPILFEALRRSLSR